MQAENVGLQTAPASGSARKDVLLGVLLFLLAGVGESLSELPGPAAVPAIAQPMGAILVLAAFLVAMVGLLFGWLAGFPRWVFPYLVYSLLFSLYMVNVATPGLAIFNIPLWGRELWGWRALVPLGLVALLALALSRPPWGNLVRLARGVWEDWTLLAFGLYGLMPFILALLLDEIEDTYRFPVILAAELVVFAGAFLHMRLAARLQRILALLAATFISAFVTGAGSAWYWQTHSVNFTTGETTLLTGPLPLDQILNRGLILAAALTLIVLLPALIGALRKWLHFINPPHIAQP